MNENNLSPSKTWQMRFKLFFHLVKKIAPFAAGMLATFLGLILYNAVFPAPPPFTTQDASTVAAQVMGSATPAPAFSEQVYQIIAPSLVIIQTKGTSPAGTSENGMGTGVVIDDQGEILTCNHVIANATSIQVTFSNGVQVNAQVVSTEPQNDIAVIQASPLPSQVVPATLGNPNAMQIGDEAYVVGNPFGLYASMSAGIISGFDRAFQLPGTNQEISGLIQVDAAVNPGNSGGPLLNRYGQVIGIVEGLANPTGQNVFIGISFAVPITTAGGALGSPPD